MQLVKHERAKTAKEIHEEHVAAMWLLFLLQNPNPKPSPDGSFYLGEIGEAKMSSRLLHRETPYSICQGRRSEEERNEEVHRYEEPRLCHCGYYHAEKKLTEVAN